MIMARNEDGTYSQVGFVKDNVGIDTEYIYDKDGDIVFEKGFTRETSDTVPLTINGIEKDLKDWSITGTTVQNGTPTPDNPVEVQAVGDRTANLYLWNGNLLGSSNLTVSENESVISSVVDVRGINTVYFTGDNTLLNSSVYRISKSDTPIEVGSTVKMFDSSFVGGVYDVSDCNYLLVTASVYNKPQENREIIKNTFMLNEGSTALPYEPYGYKIPVVTKSDGAEPITTPIYLDSPLYKIGDYADRLSKTEEVRVVKELVLTGTDADGEWKASPTRKGSFYLNIGPNGIAGKAICDRATNVTNIGNYHYGNIFVEKAYWLSSIVINLWLFDTAITLADFKSYLAAQYAAGTPVTLWYQLAKPTTETFTAPQIPTLNGTTVIDVDTAVKPTEMYTKYKSSK